MQVEYTKDEKTEKTELKDKIDKNKSRVVKVNSWTISNVISTKYLRRNIESHSTCEETMGENFFKSS